MSPFQKFRLAVLIIIALILFGTAGYCFIEKWNTLDSFYMAVITISTVGFHEIHPLSPSGKIFTIILIIASIGTVAYVVTVISSFIIEGEFSHITRRKRMDKEIESLKGHYIVCGLGRVSREIIREFKRENIKFVIVAKNADFKNDVVLENCLYLQADPSEDEVLEKAGIKEAKGLVSCLDTDEENLFVVISARSLNNSLRIITSARNESSRAKMLKAGADNVILPEIVGGRRMASMILRPQVVSFLDVMTSTQEDIPLRLEEVKVDKTSKIAGLNLKDAKIPQNTGMLVVAVLKEGKGFIYNPSSSTIIGAGDVLIVLGKEDQVYRLKEYLKSG